MTNATLTIHHDVQELLALREQMAEPLNLTGQKRLGSPVERRLLRAFTYVHLKLAWAPRKE